MLKRRKSFRWVLLLFICNIGVLYSNPIFATEEWLWPVAGITTMSRGYSSGHKGIDIWSAGIEGHDIRAAKSGTVVNSSNSCPHYNQYAITGDEDYSHYCNGGCGNFVTIDHGDGTQTRYLHMQQGTAIDIGTVVRQGDVIGKVGSSGQSSGPHCHFDIWVNGTRINNNPDVVSYSYDSSLPSDTTKPTIDSVYIHDIDSNGYYVHCIVRDDIALKEVKFPTWTSNNGQDDITWESLIVSGTSWELNYRVNYSAHNNELGGVYNTHIYCYDAAGNLADVAAVSHTASNGSEMSSGYDRVLPDGDYLIATTGTSDKQSFYYLDIQGYELPAASSTNIQLFGPTTDAPECDIWTIAYEDGFYSIKQKGTDMALDVNNTGNNAVANGRNVIVSSSNSGSNQQWAISQNGSEGYRLQAKCSGFSLDIAGANITPRANVQQYVNNDGAAQRWLFIPYKPPQPIDEGKYVLLSSIGDEWEFDVAGNTGDIENGTNVQVVNSETESQYNSFRLVKLSNGYYKFIHDASGKCLDVSGGSAANSGNIAVHEDNGSIAQQWAIFENGDGYSVIARCSGYALDVWGTNVAQGFFHGGSAQTWKFVQAEYAVNYDANGGSGTPGSQTKYYKTDLALDSSQPVRDEYNFLGWAADNADATTPDYMPGEAYTLDKDVTMYAVWEAGCDHQITYSVIMDPTLTSEGKLAGTCSICGKEKEIILPALNDAEYLYSVKEASTCQAAGTASYTWETPNGQSFVFEGSIERIDHDYAATQNPPTCIDSGSTTYTCSMCGDSYTEHMPVTVPSGEEGWTTEKPEGVPEDMILTKTQYRYSDLETTSSTASSMNGWTQTGSSASYGAYGSWSVWQTSAVSSSDTRQVETATVYPYYYFYCTHCGRGARYPYHGGTCEICGLSGYITLDTGTVDWFTNAWSGSTQWGSTNKYYQYFYDNRVGANAIYWNWTDGSASTGYRYRDRNKTITYTYERWGDWSEWGDTEYSATSTRRVETRVVYLYDAERDTRHQWKAPIYEWDETAGTLTAMYICELNPEHERTEVMEPVDVLSLPSGLKEIEEEAFAGISSQVVIIPDGCKTIGKRAFADCPNLVFVKIPDSVTSIEEDAFEGCVQLNN